MVNECGQGKSQFGLSDLVDSFLVDPVIAGIGNETNKTPMDNAPMGVVAEYKKKTNDELASLARSGDDLARSMLNQRNAVTGGERNVASLSLSDATIKGGSR